MNMKKAFFLVAGIVCIQFTQAQLTATPACPVFSVDILDGIINEKLDCSSTIGEVKKIFPCFSDVVEETGGGGCGGVFFKEPGISFITERDYIEINEKFKGKLSPALMGASRSSLFKLLGNPKLKDQDWEAYLTKYGLLVLYYDKTGKIIKLQITNKSPDSLKLCDTAQ